MSSQKFKLTVIGVIPGHNPDKVKRDLAHKLDIKPEELDALLTNDAPNMACMPHKEAWKWKQTLFQQGVDCRISAIPFETLLKQNAEPKKLDKPENAEMDIREESLGLLTEVPVATCHGEVHDFDLADSEPESAGNHYCMSPAKIKRFAWIAGCLLIVGWWYSHSQITVSEEGRQVSDLVARHLR